MEYLQWNIKTDTDVRDLLATGTAATALPSDAATADATNRVDANRTTGVINSILICNNRTATSTVNLYTERYDGSSAGTPMYILNSVANQRRLNDNPVSPAYYDYAVPFSQALQWFHDYVRDHFKTEFKKTLIPTNTWGNTYANYESSLNRLQIDPVDLKHSPDYVIIYGIDISDENCELVIEYDNNRRKNRTKHIPLKNNKFVIFPSTQRYYITQNKEKKLNGILTTVYEYI